MLAELPNVYRAPEIRIPVDDINKFKIIEHIKEDLSKNTELQISTFDGIKIEYEFGWWSIRASNTEQLIIVNFEAKKFNDLRTIKEIIKKNLANYNLII